MLPPRRLACADAVQEKEEVEDHHRDARLITDVIAERQQNDVRWFFPLQFYTEASGVEPVSAVTMSVLAKVNTIGVAALGEHILLASCWCESGSGRRRPLCC